MSNYNNACTEVCTILSYLNENEYKNIPDKVIKAIKSSRNPQYNYEFDEGLELGQQKMLKETRAILYNIFRDYLCTKEQREIIKRQQAEERQKNEINKIENYTYGDIFEKRNKDQSIRDKEQENVAEAEMAMVEYKGSFFMKIINKIKSIFH